MDSLVLVEHPSRGVARVTLNRPDARNAMNRALITACDECVATLAADSTVRAVILTGSGQAFSAGADLRERLTLSAEARTAHTAAINALIDRIAFCPVPVIGAVQGFALAGGAELALACDVRFASEDAVFGFPEVAIGIFPGAGGPVRLPRLIGPAAARDLLFTGRRVGAAEALRLGLVERVLPADRLFPEALDMAIAIARNAPQAVRALKRALIESDGLPPVHAHQVVARHRVPLDASLEYAEGLAAFSEKRPPRF